MSEKPIDDRIAEMVMEEVLNLACYTTQNSNISISMDSRLKEDLEFDNLDVVECVMQIEENMKANSPDECIAIPEEACEDIETVGDLVKAAKDAVHFDKVH